MLGPISIEELKTLLPYAILTGGAFLLLLGSVLCGKKENRWVFVFFTMITIVGTSLALCYLPDNRDQSIHRFLLHDHQGFGFAQILLLLLLLVTPVFPLGTKSFPERPSAVFGLLLLSACGGLLMIYANHLLTFLIGLELLSIPLYVLTGLSTDPQKSTEAAFKYFLLGAISSAIFIYGSALVWGTTGTATISEFGRAVSTSDKLSMVGFGLVFAGIMFKVGLVPFQMWIPDVYEGAPSSLVAWMSGAVKAAAFVLALRLLDAVFFSLSVHWATVLSWIVMLSMIWGSFGALYQNNVKRLLGYSAIAHAGYASIALVCALDGASQEAFASLTFYLLVYGLASLLSFLILSFEEEKGRTRIQDLSGMWENPALALAFVISLLSLAGMPPLGGFIGKFNIFALAVKQGRYELVFVGVITSVVSLGYYLRLLVAAYMEKAKVRPDIQLRLSSGVALGLTALLTVFLGIFPNHAIEFFLTGGK